MSTFTSNVFGASASCFPKSVRVHDSQIQDAALAPLCFDHLTRKQANSKKGPSCMHLVGRVRVFFPQGFNSAPTKCHPQHNMPFWRISSHSDLLALHQALEFEYL